MSAKVLHGKCENVLPTLPDCSVDAVVTDPPYELGFMGKGWDSTGIAYNVDMWAEVLRVLKPGGHLLAFGGTRTWHRMAVAIEDAGFEMRDSIAWLYGSGFPKSLDVSKAIDKAAGAEREVIGTRPGGYGAGSTLSRAAQSMYGYRPPGEPYPGDLDCTVPITAPATPDAERWQGWGTALKPAFEPIVVARKPLQGTVAANVLAWGTSALNIDGCRVAHANAADLAESVGKNQHTRYTNPGSNRDSYSGNMPARTDYDGTAGRWPANVILDEHAAAELDAQSGVLPPGNHPARRGGNRSEGVYALGHSGTQGERRTTDAGGASRFFPVFRYEGKAPTSERPKINGIAHPTVKPLKLIRWLVRLVTPPGGTVLDPFAGSGTTGEACILEGFNAILIEREADHLPLIHHRLTRANDALGLFGEETA